MKLKLIIICLAAWAFSSKADTNFITFTNVDGAVISNAPILSVNAVDVFYELPTGGGRVHLADLPTNLQARFGYDPAKANAAKAARSAKEHAEAQQTAATRHRVALDLSEKLFLEKVRQTKVGIYGRVIQTIREGLLVESGSEASYNTLNWWLGDGSPGANGTCLFVGYPGPRVVDGEIVNAAAYPDGFFTYTTVSGAQKTVRRYNFDPEWVLEVATPREMSLITNRPPHF
jgi:hypothetical protein